MFFVVVVRCLCHVNKKPKKSQTLEPLDKAPNNKITTDYRRLTRFAISKQTKLTTTKKNK
jgi:hypothetical protein